LVLLLTLLSTPVFGAVPLVENVTFAQRTDGSKLVDITYDVSDVDGDLLAITVHISHDGGATWDFPVLNLTGEVGQGIAPGTGRTIVWDAGLMPEPVVGESFRIRILASDEGVTYEPHSPRHVAILDFGTPDWANPQTIENFSRADFCIVMGHHLWMAGNSGHINVIQQLRSLNPNITIVGYVSVKSAHLSGPTYNPDSYLYKWYYRTEPYFMWTTTGDTAQDWPNNRLINILKPGCRQAMIETIAEMQAQSLNVFDGVFWDYFNNSIWVPDWMTVEGEVDMDEDGIPHSSDPDEMQAFRDAQDSLVHELRIEMGSEFIQIFNGQRAYGDSLFASLADGAWYELFPTLFFPEPDIAHALDPDYEFSLLNVRPWFRDQNGGPFIALGNPWINRYRDHNDEVQDVNLGNVYRAVALVVDAYSLWNVGTYGYGWTDNDISLGPALGPPVFEGNFIRRDFEFGRIEIEMTSGAYPDAFDYRIWCLGQLVEELSIPFHYP
jgi:hypothetical protein